MARGFRDEDNDLPDQELDPWQSDGSFQMRGKGRQKKTDEGFDIPDVEVKHETGAAILVVGKLSVDPFGTADEKQEEWIPLSQLHARSEVRNKGDKGLLVISSWLAEKRNKG